MFRASIWVPLESVFPMNFTEPVPFVNAMLTSNCLKADVSVKKVQMVIVEAIIGILILNRVVMAFAPSMEAASSTSFGTVERPVM